MIKINTINGNIFAHMIISGANNLYNKKQIVDDLNVFPVPDGDTGTNMSMTVNAMAAELEKKQNESLTKTADTAAFSTLRGARGNSGVILSQFFRGISKFLKGKESCGAKEFANALAEGSNSAYKAVMKPTEGTILTVAREAATGALLMSNENDDIVSVLEAAVERGNKALLKTPDMLPTLKKANVVDAGGQGWMFVLEGALHYLVTGNIITSQKETVEIKKTVQNQKNADADIKFKYCTEFLIEKNGSNCDAEEFKNTIAPYGDCMLVIDDDDIVKVHIHTNRPGFVLEEAVKIGEMINLKIDNMKHQHNSIINDDNSKTKKNEEKKAKVTASSPKKKKTSAKKKEEVSLKEYGFVAVCAGKGMAKILKDLGVDKIIEGGQTMNPSTDDIIKASKRVKAKKIIVFPNNKNIILAANQASELEKNINVIETKNIPQCISAMLAFNEKKEFEANKKSMQKAIDNVKSGQVTYAVRDTEIDDIQIKKDDILGIIGGDISIVGKETFDVLETMVKELVDEDSEFITVYTGKDLKRSEMNAAAKKLAEEYEDIEISVKYGGQPLYYYIVSVE